MNFLPPLSPHQNGLLVRSDARTKIISAWFGNTELTATLEDDQASQLALALTSRKALAHVLGTTRAYTAPSVSL